VNEFRRLLGYAAPFRGRLALAVLAMVVYAAGSVGFMLIVREIFDLLAQLELKQVQPAAVHPIALALIAAFAIKGLGAYFSSYLMTEVGQRVVMDLRNRLYRHILNQSAAFFSRLLAIYERSRDWVQASEIARKLDAGAAAGQFAGRLAHYLCEQAASAPPEQAEQLLEKALKIAPRSPRPGMELATLRRRAGDARGASGLLMDLAQSNPSALPLLAKPLTDAAIACGREADAMKLLRTSYEQTPSLDVLDGITTLESDAETARGWYVRHLQREPSLVAAAKWIAGEKLEHEQFHPDVQRALDHAVKPLTRYRCAACGFEAKQHFSQCPGCQAWDSYPPGGVDGL
jgi:lipopolysaccharide biosynthesis regulator YciM